jgi:FKBP-type peptidyl-prolyl cis-trans isomerase SlyD
VTSHSADAGVTKAGDLVLLDYELWAESGGQSDLIATTREATAQAAKADLPAEHEFGARPHLIGGDEFPAGIEGALVGLPIGHEQEKQFPPAQAFGERDPKLIELFSMHEISRLPEMRQKDAHLDIGTVLSIRGRRGRVVSMTAARVRVDFNPPFSGKTIRAKFKVERKVDEPPERARSLLELTYGRAKEFGIEVHAGTITITVPDRTKFDLGWFAAKSRVIERLRSQLQPKKIVFVEEYETPAKKEDSSGKPAAKPHAEPPAAAPTPTAPAAAAAEGDPANKPKAHSHSERT